MFKAIENGRVPKVPAAVCREYLLLAQLGELGT